MSILVLETPRLVQRPLAPADLEALVALHAEASTWWYPLRRGMTRAETEGFLERQLADYAGPDPGLHAVIERVSGQLAGHAGLSVPRFLPDVLPAVEVGWRLGERFRGRGYATEAGAAALGWAFRTLAHTEVVSIFEPENTASGRVMDRLGFDAGRPTVHPRLGLPLVVRRLTAAQWREADAVPPTAPSGQ
jgi:RimJ/RimL family protein N-acetyltransferase